MRAVVDTNVLVSALISVGSPPDQVLQAWRRGAFELVISLPLLDELERVLPRAKIASRVRWTDQRLASFVGQLRRKATVVNPKEPLEVITGDPDDNRVLEAAAEGGADYIVTGDGDLLDLARYETTGIVTPARFLAILTEATNP
jgi:putative PIN family toxin of toxin-antitoxin system